MMPFFYAKIRIKIKTIKNKKKSFKDRLIETFGVNPFICSKCGENLELWEIWIPQYGTVYNILYKSNYRTIITEEVNDSKDKINIDNYEQQCLF